jgi:cyclase
MVRNWRHNAVGLESEKPREAQHMIDAVKQAGASAVAAASIFHFTEQTPAEAKAAMANVGIPVRDPFRESTPT